MGGHYREEGGPLCPAPPPDLAAAHRVAAGAREARARVVERGGGAPPAAAFAARALLEGQRGCKRHHRTGRSAVGARSTATGEGPVTFQTRPFLVFLCVGLLEASSQQHPTI